MSFGLVPSDLATSNARVAQNLVATNARFGSLTATDFLTDRITTAVVDTGTLNATDVSATDATVTNLTATDIKTDTETVTTLDATTVNAGDVTASGTVTATTATVTNLTAAVIHAGNLIATGTVGANRLEAVEFPQNMVGSVRLTGANVNPTNYFTVPIQMVVNNTDVNLPNQTFGTLYLPQAITVVAFEGSSASAPALAVTATLVYVADPAVAGSPTAVFPSSTVTNATWSRTGSVTVPAGQYLSVRFEALTNAAVTYNSWTIKYYLA